MDRSRERYDERPLPEWRQRWNSFRGYLRRTRGSRQKAYANLKNAGARLLTLAISVVGAILISYGAWMIYAPTGFIVGGMLAWLLLWSAEKDKERST